MKTILVTGGAGFIGFSLIKSLLKISYLKIINVDNLNNYYDVKLKKDRLNLLENLSKKNKSKYKFIKGDLSDKKFISNLFKKKIDYVVNLAAQAGVRYSIQNPDAYFDSNIKGFYNLIEQIKKKKLNILFLLVQAVFMEKLRNIQLQRRLARIIQFNSMQQLKNVMK